MSLRARIESLASDFAAAVVAAVRRSSLDEIVNAARAGSKRQPRPSRSASAPRSPAQTSSPPHAPASPSSARSSPGSRTRSSSAPLKRRSPAEIAAALDKVVRVVTGKKNGLRAEQIQKILHMDRREMPRVLAAGLARKRLARIGIKRATTYFAL